MSKIDPAVPAGADENAECDLAHRLARYRKRVESEGRPRSVRVIDRAIKDAAKPTRAPK